MYPTGVALGRGEGGSHTMKRRQSSRVIRCVSACGLLIAAAVSCQTQQKAPQKDQNVFGNAVVPPIAQRAWRHQTFSSHTLQVSVTDDEFIFLGRDRVSQFALDLNLRHAREADSQAFVFLKIARPVKYGLVAMVVDATFESGAKSLFFVVRYRDTEPPFSPGFDYIKPVKRSEPLVLTLKPGMNHSLDIALEDKAFASLNDLVAELTGLMNARTPRDRHIFLKPHDDVSYQDLIGVLDGATGAGMQSFTLWTPNSSKLFPTDRPVP
jgi:biopolymer transport protein ExbD